MTTTETSFKVELCAAPDGRDELEPAVVLEVKYLQPGDEDVILSQLEDAMRRARIFLGRSLEANEGQEIAP